MDAAPSSGAVAGVPKLILKLEGAALLIGAAFFYARFEGSWLWFAVLFLAPDLSFIAYPVSTRAGAIAYNAVHSTLGPLALIALAAWLGWDLGERLALIWLAHVGADRALGYGLKYATAFNDTHLGRIGKSG
ncbi:DUF4260 domain-containing protein [Methylocapsa sp. S129]|uniref:DUF4260 domain-containing protein n=1 Tax=Methylocapsa sp. S129 TaxID=1641869 RepID=UPI00131A8D3F|nr:DUF4260 domain-containing protein [Methylocapsa sp. S129]